LDDTLLALDRQGRPIGVEFAGFPQHLIGGQVTDFEVRDLGLQLGKLVLKLKQLRLQGLVVAPETLQRNLPVKVEPVGARHLLAHLLDFPLMDG
jgi:hypothetical protein